MKKVAASIVFVIIIGVFTLNLIFAADIPNYQDKYLNDFAKIFGSSETDYLRAMLFETEQNTTAEFVVVTIDSCGQDYDGFAMQIVENWKIGKADKDNGLLELYCQAEKRLVVKTGYGIEGILPDSKVGRMLDDYYVPLRDEGKIKEGIIRVAEEYAKVLNENKEEIISGQASGDSGKDIDIAVIIFWLFIAYIILSKILGRVYKGKKNRDLPWFIPIFFPIRSNSSGTFSGGAGGFGGGSFGGGGFGGGGASR